MSPVKNEKLPGDLREEVIRMSELFEQTRINYMILDHQGVIAYVNPAWETQLAYSASEVQGMPFAAFLRSGDQDIFKKELLKCQNEDSRKEVELVLNCSDGSALHALFSCFCVRNNLGNPDRFHCTFQNVTRLRATEKALKDSEYQYKRIFNSFQDVYYQTDEHGKIILISPSIRKFGGYIPAEVIGKSVARFFRSRQERKAFHERMIRDGAVEDYDLEILHKDGHGIPSSLTARVFREDENDTLRVEGVLRDISRRKGYEKEIAYFSERLSELYNFGRVGIATMSLKGVVTDVNPIIPELTGYSRDELVGRHFKDVEVFYAKDLPRYVKLFGLALINKLPTDSVVFQFKHKDGKPRWGEAFLNVNKIDGKITGFQGVFMEITDRVELERAQGSKRRDSEFLFDSAMKFLRAESESDLYKILGKQLVKAIPDAIINLNSINDDTNILRVESVSGLSGPIRSKAVKLIGSQLRGKTFEIDRTTFSYARHGKLMKVHENLYELTLHQLPEGICRQLEKLIHLREIWEISLGVDDEIMGGCAIFLCRDQQIEHPQLVENLFRQATEALNRLRAHRIIEEGMVRYRSLAENSGDMILRVDDAARVLYCNQAFCNLVNRKAEHTLNTSILEFGFPEAISKLIHSTLMDCIAGGKAGSCEHMLQFNEQSRFFEWRMFPETSQGKSVQSIIIYIHEITHRKEAEARIMEGKESQNRIYRLISHDLRNPFNSMLGFMELLQGRYDDLSDEVRKKYLNLISESAGNLHSLLNSLQEWTRQNRQNEQLKPIHFEAHELVDSCIELFRLNAMEKKLELINHVPKNTLIRADYNMVAAICRNLLSNACKFSHPEGRIEIELHRENGDIALEIKDHGQGMSAGEIKELLKPDSSFSREGTSGEKGSGLGFRFAQHFAEQNGGRIEISSEKGKGSTVRLVLPDVR